MFLTRPSLVLKRLALNSFSLRPKLAEITRSGNDFVSKRYLSSPDTASVAVNLKDTFSEIRQMREMGG